MTTKRILTALGMLLILLSCAPLFTACQPSSETDNIVGSQEDFDREHQDRVIEAPTTTLDMGNVAPCIDATLVEKWPIVLHDDGKISAVVDDGKKIITHPFPILNPMFISTLDYSTRVFVIVNRREATKWTFDGKIFTEVGVIATSPAPVRDIFTDSRIFMASDSGVSGFGATAQFHEPGPSTDAVCTNISGDTLLFFINTQHQVARLRLTAQGEKLQYIPYSSDAHDFIDAIPVDKNRYVLIGATGETYFGGFEKNPLENNRLEFNASWRSSGSYSKTVKTFGTGYALVNAKDLITAWFWHLDIRKPEIKAGKQFSGVDYSAACGSLAAKSIYGFRKDGAKIFMDRYTWK